VGQVSYYAIYALDSTGNVSDPLTGNATRPSTPAAPSGLVAAGGWSGVSLDWSDNTEGDLAGYRIYRSNAANGTFSLVNTGGPVAASQYIDTTAPNGVSYYRVTAVNSSGTESAVSATVNGARQTPFKGTPFAVGGTPVTIQAEDYDFGGQDVAFNDTTTSNIGGQYRPSEAVDISAIAGAPGTYRISSAVSGEWMEYTTDVSTGGTYLMEFRVGNTDPGSTFHVEINGVNVTGALSVPDTDSFDAFATVSKQLTLQSGVQVIRFVFDNASSGGNGAAFDWMKITQQTAAPVTRGASADAYVRGGTSAGTNFGSATIIDVKESSSADNKRTGYLKFDLTGITSVSSATIRLYGYLADASTPTAVSLYDVANTTWSQSTINFNNAPASNGSAVATKTITGFSSTAGAYYDFDVTSYIQAAIAANKTTVSLAIKAAAGSNVRVSFNTSEAAANTPDSVVTPQQAAGPATPSGLTVDGASGGIQLDWANNSEPDLAGYYVYRSSSPSGTYTRISGASPITVSDYLDTTAPAGEISYYRVTGRQRGEHRVGPRQRQRPASRRRHHRPLPVPGQSSPPRARPPA
jgi:hypothetical protein